MKRTIFVTALLPLVVLAGCATGNADPGVASASGGTPTAEPAADDDSATGDPVERARQFAQCMRDHGIDMPDPDANGSVTLDLQGTDQSKFDAASEACKEFAPGAGGEHAQVDPATLDKMRQFSQCMRDHGLADFPDPSADGGLQIKADGSSGLDPDSDVFKKAQEACQSIMPEPPGGGGGVRVNVNGPAAGGGS
jgi:hypothetical protein